MGECGDRLILGAHWPTSITETVSSRYIYIHTHIYRKCPAGLPVLDLTEAFSQLRLALLPSDSDLCPVNIKLTKPLKIVVL